MSSPFAHKHYSRGYYDGWEEGKFEGKASFLLYVLGRRAVPLSDADRERIATCTDPALMSIWAQRCISITSAEELFAEGRPVG
ncbi:hypothetical protein DP939_01385 [Spongiactinospora rosea]|uniref:Uncharacterized protein n=1 Tax=Spongiactinospora rosea TaxID=2248750 RepID=A0A366M5A1_9ACTN|nr:hypothetical protein DP939_01385 [Spongiactinospora rosea]